MNVRARSLREATEEIFQQFCLQASDVFSREFPFADQMGPAAEVDGGSRESFVHWHQEVSRAQNAPLRSERFFDRLAEDDPRVLDCMVLVHVEIAARGEFQIHCSVARHEREHMIEERNAGRDFRAAATIEVQAHSNIGFRCGAAQIRFSHRQNLSRSFTLCSTARAPNSRSLVARNRYPSLPSGSTPKKGTRARLAASASSILSPT